MNYNLCFVNSIHDNVFAHVENRESRLELTLILLTRSLWRLVAEQVSRKEICEISENFQGT